jgi:hypothetical protein
MIVGFPVKPRGGAMSLSLKSVALKSRQKYPTRRVNALCLVAASLLLFADVAFCQNAPGAPKYDRQTEMKTNVLTVGSRKDFTELVLKSGDDKLHIYVCPKPFQDEMGINFIKGDELAITGSKVKQEASEIILAREMVKGTDTLMFRDDKGKPVWDERTGK